MLKRFVDILAGALGLILLAPVMLLIGVAVRLSMGPPILFQQMRAGKAGVDFRLVKFRSMREANGADGMPLPDEERVTLVGRFLRRSRLDELPELWLVLIGRMSLVGPRPLPRSTLEQYGVLAQRSKVRPGLTGLAQVSGNTLLTPSEKFAVDLYYADRQGLIGDIGILCKTLVTVARGERRDEVLIGKAVDHANDPDRHRR